MVQPETLITGDVGTIENPFCLHSFWLSVFTLSDTNTLQSHDGSPILFLRNFENKRFKNEDRFLGTGVDKNFWCLLFLLLFSVSLYYGDHHTNISFTFLIVSWDFHEVLTPRNRTSAPIGSDWNTSLVVRTRTTNRTGWFDSLSWYGKV